MTDIDPKTMGVTGGCQCGAVRYRLDLVEKGTHICHCRMCQKASGGPFMASVLTSSLIVTRGKLSTFASSEIAERGFCAACGTPLTYRSIPGAFVIVTIGSLDDPNAFSPKAQYGAESRVSWLSEAMTSPETALSDWFQRKGIASVGSHQHPDHET